MAPASSEKVAPGDQHQQHRRDHHQRCHLGEAGNRHEDDAGVEQDAEDDAGHDPHPAAVVTPAVVAEPAVAAPDIPVAHQLTPP
jgi:hypothetical protein